MWKIVNLDYIYSKWNTKISFIKKGNIKILENKWWFLNYREYGNRNNMVKMKEHLLDCKHIQKEMTAVT